MIDEDEHPKEDDAHIEVEIDDAGGPAYREGPGWPSPAPSRPFGKQDMKPADWSVKALDERVTELARAKKEASQRSWGVKTGSRDEVPGFPHLGRRADGTIGVK